LNLVRAFLFRPLAIILGVLSAGCAGTYRPVEYDMPSIPSDSPYAVISGVQVTAKEGVSNQEMNDFDVALRRALERRGIRVDLFSDAPLLNVQLHRLHAESPAWYATKYALGISIPGSSSNAITVQMETWRHGRLLKRFDEFDEYREKTPSWEAMKLSVANRIADALFYAR
jgi:hypothetical protein